MCIIVSSGGAGGTDVQLLFQFSGRIHISPHRQKFCRIWRRTPFAFFGNHNNTMSFSREVTEAWNEWYVLSFPVYGERLRLLSVETTLIPCCFQEKFQKYGMNGTYCFFPALPDKLHTECECIFRTLEHCYPNTPQLKTVVSIVKDS